MSNDVRSSLRLLRRTLALAGALSAVLVAGAATATGDVQPGVLERKLDAPLRLFALQPESALKLYDHRLSPLPESGSALEKSSPATRADTLRTGVAPNWSGLTGKNVIVGIIDDGLDFRHRDFRKVDGTTRLLGLWDQRANGAAGAPPAGFTYGGECTPVMLNSSMGGVAAIQAHIVTLTQ